MAAAPPAASVPLRTPASALSGILDRLDGSFLALSQQLASNPIRVRTSVRMALIAAVGAGLCAAMHIDEPLGVYVLWSLVSAPAAMMVPLRGLGFIAVAAISLALSIPLAGSLAETPWLMVPFFSLTAAAFSYHFTDAQLSNGWRMIEVVFLTTFFIIIFDPKNFGWSVGYTFGGMCVAFGTVMLFDNVLWPDPADARLLKLLDGATEVMRKRLALVGRAYLDPSGKTALPPPTLIGPLSAHLALLARADREDLIPLRHALLLGAVASTERRRVEIERMLGIAREPVPRGIRQLVRPEMEAALTAIDASLATQAAHFASEFYASQPDTVTPVEDALTVLNDRITELHPKFITHVRADELSNMSAFIIGMQRLGRLFRHPPIAMSDAARKPKVTTSSQRDPAKVRYAIKIAAAMAIAFIVAMTAQRADLKTIILTVMITGLPTYGGSLHKMILRFLGGTMGGVFALTAIIVSSPNFETILSFMTVCFVMFFVAAYIGLSGGGLGYAGKQAGTTFALVFIELSPSLAVTEPLYRLWGVFLGVIVVAFVFLILAPDYAGEAMVPRLEKMLQVLLSLMPSPTRRLADREIEAIEIESGRILGELLEVADDARIEGRSSIVNPDAIIETVGTMRRISHRLASAAVSRNLIELPSLTPGFDAARAGFLGMLNDLFRDCDELVSLRTRAKPRWDSARAKELLDTLGHEVAADNFAGIDALSLQARRALLSDMENARRISVLAAELAEQLPEIRPSERASA